MSYKELVKQAYQILKDRNAYGIISMAAEIHGIHFNNFHRYLRGVPKKEKSYEQIYQSIMQAAKQKEKEMAGIYEDLNLLKSE